MDRRKRFIMCVATSVVCHRRRIIASLAHEPHWTLPISFWFSIPMEKTLIWICVSLLCSLESRIRAYKQSLITLLDEKMDAAGSCAFEYYTIQGVNAIC